MSTAKLCCVPLKRVKAIVEKSMLVCDDPAVAKSCIFIDRCCACIWPYSLLLLFSVYIYLAVVCIYNCFASRC